jgi:hypothetical protein
LLWEEGRQKDCTFVSWSTCFGIARDGVLCRTGILVDFWETKFQRAKNKICASATHFKRGYIYIYAVVQGQGNEIT